MEKSEYLEQLCQLSQVIIGTVGDADDFGSSCPDLHAVGTVSSTGKGHGVESRTLWIFLLEQVDLRRRVLAGGWRP